LRLKCDEPLSKVAFNFNLRHYTMGNGSGQPPELADLFTDPPPADRAELYRATTLGLERLKKWRKGLQVTLMLPQECPAVRLVHLTGRRGRAPQVVFEGAGEAGTAGGAPGAPAGAPVGVTPTTPNGAGPAGAGASAATAAAVAAGAGGAAHEPWALVVVASSPEAVTTWPKVADGAAATPANPATVLGARLLDVTSSPAHFQALRTGAPTVGVPHDPAGLAHCLPVPHPKNGGALGVLSTGFERHGGSGEAEEVQGGGRALLPVEVKVGQSRLTLSNSH
jgi:hypothetical protein